MEKEKLIYPELSYKIVGCLFDVYNDIGPNHREQYYQKATAIEFRRQKILFVEQVSVDLEYKNETIGKNFLDFLIDGKIVLELKVGTYFKKKDFDQILSYLKLTKLKLGIIVIFTPDGVKFHRILNIK